MRRAHRLDENHAAIVTALEKAGCTVTSLAGVGNGVPDLLVSRGRRWYLLEAKARIGKLTDDQKHWLTRQQADVYVVRNEEEALRAVGLGDSNWREAMREDVSGWGEK